MASSPKCLCGGIVVGFCLFAGVVSGGDDDAQSRILELARSGKNADVIHAYEALPDRKESDVAILRAAAGAYWREGHFEEARLLYRVIMNRQSNANSPESGERDAVLDENEASEKSTPVVVANEETENDESSLIAIDPKASDARDTETIPEPTPRADNPKIAVLEARIKALEQDVASARMAYEQLKADSDRKINDLLDSVQSEKSRRQEAESDLLAIVALLETQRARIRDLELRSASLNGQEPASDTEVP